MLVSAFFFHQLLGDPISIRMFLLQSSLVAFLLNVFPVLCLQSILILSDFVRVLLCRHRSMNSVHVVILILNK